MSLERVGNCQSHDDVEQQQNQPYLSKNPDNTYQETNVQSHFPQLSAAHIFQVTLTYWPLAHPHGG